VYVDLMKEYLGLVRRILGLYISQGRRKGVNIRRASELWFGIVLGFMYTCQSSRTYS